MAQEDLSSPTHRVANLSKGKFVRAYAELYNVIHDSRWSDKPVSDLRVVCEVLNANLAEAFDLTATTVVGMLVDVTSPERVFKTGSGPAESPVGAEVGSPYDPDDGV